MRVTEFTKRALRYRRVRRALEAEGFEEVQENGAPLWEMHRGARWNHIITDVRIGPEGRSVFIKLEPHPERNKFNGYILPAKEAVEERLLPSKDYQVNALAVQRE